VRQTSTETLFFSYSVDTQHSLFLHFQKEKRFLTFSYTIKMSQESHPSTFPEMSSEEKKLSSSINSVNSISDDGSSEAQCKVCRGTESTPDNPLCYPCKCKGSIKYVHQKCLEAWLAHSRTNRCEVSCGLSSFAENVHSFIHSFTHPFIHFSLSLFFSFSVVSLFLSHTIVCVVCVALSIWLCLCSSLCAECSTFRRSVGSH
jgi:hypothetical protein